MRGGSGVEHKQPSPLWRVARALAGLAGGLVLAGCAGTKYTVDDGRQVNEALLGQIQRYGQVERTVRPAIQRSAALQDRDCDKQWELPFTVTSSQAWSADDRVAWVRALGVDERLTVVAATADSPLKVGERIVQVGGRETDDASYLAEWLSERRDDGKPFRVKLAEGRVVEIRPFEVCRGYTRFAPPDTPEAQDYHWLMSLHPLELADAKLSEDEALWVVLWGQGLSEEGGARMKTYHYGSKVVGTLYNLFTIASGLKGAALAADAAMKAAQTAAANVANEILKQQIIAQAKEFAIRRMREGVTEATQKMLSQQAVTALQQAAVNRGSLSGVARVAATVFDRADQWAYQRASLLAANPLAGFTLHQKLVEQGLGNSVFVFDLERLEGLTQVAEAQGQGAAVVAALNGLKPSNLAQEVAGMPLASARRGFSYDDPTDLAPGGTYSRGLIDASLALPFETRK